MQIENVSERIQQLANIPVRRQASRRSVLTQLKHLHLAPKRRGALDNNAAAICQDSIFEKPAEPRTEQHFGQTRLVSLPSACVGE